MKKHVKFVRELTALFIKYQEFSQPLIDILIEAQARLDEVERKEYNKWHMKKWPNLDW